MAIKFLKKATKTAVSEENKTRETVAKILREIQKGGEKSVEVLSKKFDSWDGNIVVNKNHILEASSKVSAQLKDDINFAHERVRLFAEHQKESIKEFETELSPGLWAGQKLIPVSSAGCYVPGGRYAHVASAIMSALSRLSSIIAFISFFP